VETVCRPPWVHNFKGIGDELAVAIVDVKKHGGDLSVAFAIAGRSEKEGIQATAREVRQLWARE